MAKGYYLKVTTINGDGTDRRNADLHATTKNGAIREFGACLFLLGKDHGSDSILDQIMLAEQGRKSPLTFAGNGGRIITIELQIYPR